jgi:putative Mn2+ efflux pump MntP
VAELLSLLLVSVSVGLSNFAGAIGIGLSGINARTRLRVGLAFGAFEALMPVIGLLIGSAAAGYIGNRLGGLIAGIILILTGLYTIAEGRRVDREAQPKRGMRTNQLIFTAFALSIDNLAVGFALAVYHVQILLAALTMGVVSVGMSLVGLEIGYRAGKHVEAFSEEIGGGVLILVGVVIATGLMH